MTALVAFAVALIAQRTIKGNTWAEDRVDREPIDPFNSLAKSYADSEVTPQRPLIVIYADKAQTSPENRDTSADFVKVDLAISIIVAPGMTRLPDGLDFKLNGGQANLTLPVVARQIENALRSPNGPWADLWKKHVQQITEVESRPLLYETTQGVKIPFLEVRYELNCKTSPDFGEDIPPRWRDFLSALTAAGGEDAILSDLLRTLLETTDINDFDPIQRMFGLTDSAMAAAGLGPIPGSANPDTGQGADLTSVTLTGDVTVEQTLVPNDE